MTVTWSVEGAVSAEELTPFTDGRAGMSQGWDGSFDKLSDYIKPDRELIRSLIPLELVNAVL